MGLLDEADVCCFPEQAKSWLRCRARCGSCCRRCSTDTPWQGAQRRKSGTRAPSTTCVRSPPSPRSLARLAQPRHLGQTRILLKSARAFDRGSGAADDRDDHERAACEESCRARRCEGAGEAGPLRQRAARRQKSNASMVLCCCSSYDCRPPAHGDARPEPRTMHPRRLTPNVSTRRDEAAPGFGTTSSGADKMSHSAMCSRAQPSKWKPRLA